jgi:hypothetical protein
MKIIRDNENYLTEYFEEKEREDFSLISVRIYLYRQEFYRFYHVDLLYDVDDRFVHPEMKFYIHFIKSLFLLLQNLMKRVNAH